MEGDTQTNVKQEADSSRTEITTSVFNEIDLHVDGIPQEAILNDEIQMKDIKETLQKLQIGSQMQSMRHDLNKEDMIFCKESSKAIYEMGNVELIELSQTTSTVQCRPCWKHIPEGVLQCLCGNWLKTEEHTVNQIKLRFAELVRPCYRVLKISHEDDDTDYLPWQQAHWKAKDAKKGALKHTHSSTLERWQNDEYYRTDQAEEHGWSEEWVKYLDFLTRVDISYTATNYQRNRYENMAHIRSTEKTYRHDQFVLGKIGKQPQEHP